MPPATEAVTELPALQDGRMNWLRKIFGSSAPTDGAIHLYVRCKRCGAPIHVRVDPRNELTIEYGDDEQPSGYQLIKEIMDARCFRLMRAELTFDARKRELSREIEGGTFITHEEYEQAVARGEHERRA
jgi:hypothetical protein